MEGLTNPFGVAHDEYVSHQGGPSLSPSQKGAKEEKAQINAPENNPLGNSPTYVIKAAMKKGGY